MSIKEFYAQTQHPNDDLVAACSSLSDGDWQAVTSPGGDDSNGVAAPWDIWA